MVNSKRDLNLKVDRQRNIKQFDQTIVLGIYGNKNDNINNFVTINDKTSISIIKIN